MRKLKVIDYNNLRENSKIFEYAYKQGDKVPIHKDDLNIIKKAEIKHKGLYSITQVYTNVTFRIQRGIILSVSILDASPLFLIKSNKLIGVIIYK